MDDDAPPPRRQLVEPRPLDSLGIEELQLYIAALNAEAARAEAMIARKAGHRGTADALFRFK